MLLFVANSSGKRETFQQEATSNVLRFVFPCRPFGLSKVALI